MCSSVAGGTRDGVVVVYSRQWMCWLVLAVGLPGCLDYGLFGKDGDPEEGGRKANRPDPNVSDDELVGGDTAEPDDDSHGTIDTDDTDDTDDPGDSGDSGDPVAPANCDGYSAPADYSVPAISTCTNTTPLYALSPTLEWSWTTNRTHAGWNNVETAPLVAHLTDDNGDGVIGSGDVPDIVILSQSGDDYWSGKGALTVLDGQTGAEHWSIRDASGEGFNSASQATVGDLDADGQPEICVAGYTSAVVCVDGASGTLEFAAGTEISLFGGVVMGDLDGDGYGEVVYGRQIFDHQGNTVAVGTGGSGGIEFYGFPGFGSVIADWDGDSQQEVVAVNTVYERDGTIIWEDGRDDGLVAVADLDLDGLPDVVRCGLGELSAVDNAGTELFSISTPGTGPGGPPSIADLDQDGIPEILISDFTAVSAVDVNGTVLWSTPIRDTSSGSLGVSTADLDGDGFPEVLHADEVAWRILDGRTGTVLHEDTGHASSTAGEFPVVADVDVDGEAEILVASNNGNFSGWNGLRVYGSGGTVTWPPAREVWNQHA